MFELVSQQVPALALLAMGALGVIGLGVITLLAYTYYSEARSGSSWEAFKEELDKERAWAKGSEKLKKLYEKKRKARERARRKARRKGF